MNTQFFTYDFVDPRFDNLTIYYTGKGNSDRVKHLNRNDAVNARTKQILEAGFSKSDILVKRPASSEMVAFYEEAVRYEQLVTLSQPLLNEQPCYISTWEQRYKNELALRGTVVQDLDQQLLNVEAYSKGVDSATPADVAELMVRHVKVVDVHATVAFMCDRFGVMLYWFKKLNPNHVGKIVVFEDNVKRIANLLMRNKGLDIQIVTVPVLEFNTKMQFDHIFMNPPFSVTGGKSDNLYWAKFVRKAQDMLNDTGMIWAVLPKMVATRYCVQAVISNHVKFDANKGQLGCVVSINKTNKLKQNRRPSVPRGVFVPYHLHVVNSTELNHNAEFNGKYAIRFDATGVASSVVVGTSHPASFNVYIEPLPGFTGNLQHLADAIKLNHSSIGPNNRGRNNNYVSNTDLLKIVSELYS